MNGKGSRQRPTNKATFDDNFDRIFGRNKDRAQGSGVDGKTEQPAPCDNDGPIGATDDQPGDGADT